MKSWTPVMCIAGVMLSAVAFSDATGWTDSAQVLRREGAVVSYRARLAGDFLVVEATHAAGWHTYSMDNIDRARARTGKEKPETELPTRIDVSGGLEVVGHWYQSEPKELSQPEIHWYTWGFEGAALFAAKVRRTGADSATVTINGQSCNATSCSMVSDLTLEVPIATDGGSAEFDLSELVEVRPAENGAG